MMDQRATWLLVLLMGCVSTDAVPPPRVNWVPDITQVPVPRGVLFHAYGQQEPRLRLLSATDTVQIDAIEAEYGFVMVPQRFLDVTEYEFWDQDRAMYGTVGVLDELDDVPPQPVAPVAVVPQRGRWLFAPDMTWIEVHWDAADTEDIAGWLVEVSAEPDFSSSTWGLGAPTIACAGEASPLSCVPFPVRDHPVIWFRAYPVDSGGNVGDPTEPIEGAL